MITNFRLANTFFLVLFHFCLVLVITIPSYGIAGDIGNVDVQVVNTATYVDSGRYNWSVFLVGKEKVLNSIKYVQYTLHPSFPQPQRTVYDRETNFTLNSNGWGEFNIYVKIVFDSGRKMYLEHWLSLEKMGRVEIETNTACDEQSRQLIVELYATAWSYPDNLSSLIYNNRDLYIDDNRWQNCSERFVQALMTNALSGPSDNETRESAYSIAADAGVPGMGESLYKQMISDKMDMFALANYLNDLALIVPDINQGDLLTYYNLEIYNYSQFLWNMMGIAFSPNEIELWKQMIYQLNSWWIDNLLQTI